MKDDEDKEVDCGCGCELKDALECSIADELELGVWIL